MMERFLERIALSDYKDRFILKGGMLVAEAVFDEVEESPVMEKLWHSYQKNYSYAAALSWHTVMDSVRSFKLIQNDFVSIYCINVE